MLTRLTKTCKEYVHRIPMNKEPMVPTNRPALKKAFGIAKIPVPKLHLIK